MVVLPYKKLFLFYCMKPKEHAVSPEFSAFDQNGERHSLGAYKGKWVLLYFYPKDDTPGCTTEACQIRDAWNGFAKAGIVVLGVSADSTKSHQKFVTKFKLPFPLLVDEDRKIIQAYGAWGKKKFMGREYEGVLRISFLINPQGVIVKIYESVKPDGHAEEVLADFKKFVQS